MGALFYANTIQGESHIQFNTTLTNYQVVAKQ